MLSGLVFHCPRQRFGGFDPALHHVNGRHTADEFLPLIGLEHGGAQVVGAALREFHYRVYAGVFEQVAVFLPEAGDAEQVGAVDPFQDQRLGNSSLNRKGFAAFDRAAFFKQGFDGADARAPQFSAFFGPMPSIAISDVMSTPLIYDGCIICAYGQSFNRLLRRQNSQPRILGSARKNPRAPRPNLCLACRR